MRPIVKQAFTNASLTALYVALVGSFFHFAPAIFGNPPNTPDTLLVPIFMLLLFVFSATLCGALMLGKPLLWYLDGKKKEAVELFAHSLGIFFAIAVLVFILLYIFG